MLQVLNRTSKSLSPYGRASIRRIRGKKKQVMIRQRKLVEAYCKSKVTEFLLRKKSPNHKGGSKDRDDSLT